MSFEIWTRTLRASPILASLDQLFREGAPQTIIVKSPQDKLTLEGFQLMFGQEVKVKMWYWGIPLRPSDHGLPNIFYMYDPRAEVRDQDEL